MIKKEKTLKRVKVMINRGLRNVLYKKKETRGQEETRKSEMIKMGIRIMRQKGQKKKKIKKERGRVWTIEKK